MAYEICQEASCICQNIAIPSTSATKYIHLTDHGQFAGIALCDRYFDEHGEDLGYVVVIDRTTFAIGVGPLP